MLNESVLGMTPVCCGAYSSLWTGINLSGICFSLVELNTLEMNVHFCICVFPKVNMATVKQGGGRKES